MEYTQYRKLDDIYIKNKIQEFLAEDCPLSDITTDGIFSQSDICRAEIVAEDNLIFSGEDIIRNIFSNPCKVELFVKDSQIVFNKDIIAFIQGPYNTLLKLERLMLNLIQRLCGIATLTNKYVEIAYSYGVKILDTRKTTPGMRLFEKYAVTCGGGFNHRLDLSSGILIKDNHIKAAGGIIPAIEKIRSMNSGFPIEVETETLKDISDAIEARADGILLDNMPPDLVREAVILIREFSQEKPIFIEASGGINLDTLEEYCKTGIDAVSIGALTHSAKSSNIHLEFI